MASTSAIKANDSVYLSTEQQIQQLTSQRDALARQMKNVLDGSAIGHVDDLIAQGQDLLAQAAALAGE